MTDLDTDHSFLASEDVSQFVGKNASCGPRLIRNRRRYKNRPWSHGLAWPCLALLLSLSSVGYAASETVSATTDDLSTYTAIPNVRPNVSFLRIFGATGTATNVEIRSFGNQTGREYTTKPLRIPILANASPQQFVPALDDAASLAGAGRITPEGPDTTVTLYVRNTDSAVTSLYQLVTYNPTTQILENASVCSYNSRTPDLSILNHVALNVHTSLIPSYVSMIGITNPASVARTIQIAAYYSDTGETVVNYSGYTATVPAASTIRIPYSEIAGAAFNSPDHPHVDLVMYEGDSLALPFSAMLSHSVVNVLTGVESNLTQLCPIAPPPATGTPTGPTDPSPDPINCPLARTGANSQAIIQEILYNYTASCPADRDWPADKSTPGYLSPDSGADGRIATPDDVDWWKVDLVAGNRYDFNFRPGNFDLSNRRMALRDPNGVPIPGALVATHITTTATGAKYDPQTTFLYQATVTGTYYIEVSAALEGALPNLEGNAGTTGKYQLQVVSR